MVIRLSATRIKAYLTCPRKYRYAYLDNIPAVPTGAVVFGRVMHQTLYRLHVAAEQQTANLNVEAGFREFDALWRAALEAEQPLFTEGSAGAQTYWDLADDMLRGYIALQQETAAPLAVEFPFELRWEDCALSGIIDRIDMQENSLVVMDYKTGQRKPAPQALRDDLQLTLYAYAAEQVFKRPVERIVHYHLRDHSQLVTTRTPQDVQRLTQGILRHSVLPRLNASESDPSGSQQGFEPRFGYWCRFCDYRELCLADTPQHRVLTTPTRLTAMQHRELPTVEGGTQLSQVPTDGAAKVSTEPEGIPQPATPAQCRAIEVLVARSPLSQEPLGQLLQARFGRDAVTALHYGQASQLLLELQRQERLKAQAMKQK